MYTDYIYYIEDTTDRRAVSAIPNLTAIPSVLVLSAVLIFYRSYMYIGGMRRVYNIIIIRVHDSIYNAFHAGFEE